MHYVEVLGFTYANHLDKIDHFATVYRDAVEIVIVQRKKGIIESNTQRYGAGYDAYINTDSLEGIESLYQEYQQKGVNILTSPHMTDYGSREFTFEDCEGRILGVGLIADKETYFRHSNHVSVMHDNI